VVVALVAGAIVLSVGVVWQWHRDEARVFAVEAGAKAGPLSPDASETPQKTENQLLSDSDGAIEPEDVRLTAVTLDPQPTADDDKPGAAWPSEALAEALDARLEGFANALAARDVAAVMRYLATNVKLSGEPLAARTKIGDGTVTRLTEGDEAVVVEAAVAAKTLVGRLLPTGRLRVRFKIEGVQDRRSSSGGVSALARLAVVASKAERHSVWEFSLTLGPLLKSGRVLLIAGVRISEDVVVAIPKPLFADATAKVLSGLDSQSRQTMLADADTWLRTLDASFLSDPIGHQGLAVGDVNGDGLDDVYVCAPAGVPNRLLIQQPDGSVKDEALRYGVALLDLSRSALLVDLDSDGDQDLVVATRSSDTPHGAAVLLFSGNGVAAFGEPEEILVGGDTHSMAAADYDNDGDLDLYMCLLNADKRIVGGFGVPVPYHDAKNGGRNRLLANDGALRFRDVTAAVGLDVGNSRWSYAAAWEDYDNDGDQDLYVANDFGKNNLYRNDKGRFVDVAAAANVEDISSGMSVSWGDVDRDGHMDLYVSNMYSAAGRRVTSQRAFQATAPKAARDGMALHARGNSMFLNNGDGTFRDVSNASGTTVAKWAWGALLTDLNGDGYKDVAVVNGMFTRADPGDL
jgi:hypothetical protein